MYCGLHKKCTNELISSLSSLFAVDISFEMQHSLMAVHTRIGAGYFDASTLRDTNSGFFMPKTNDVDPVALLEEIHFWTVLARSIGTTVVEFIVIPGCSRFKQDATFYLRAAILIPEGYEVTNIEFYSDDGNSSLSPPTIDENVDINEGRQSVSFLVKCANNNDSTLQQHTELWVFRYDDVLFWKFDFDKNMTNEVTIRATPSSDESNYMRFVMSGDEMIDDDDGVIGPKSEFELQFVCFFMLNHPILIFVTFLIGRLITTQLSSQNHHHQTQVHLCGSRGTGGVLTLGAPTCLNIFDLEEDEDEE